MPVAQAISSHGLEASCGCRPHGAVGILEQGEQALDHLFVHLFVADRAERLDHRMADAVIVIFQGFDQGSRRFGISYLP